MKKRSNLKLLPLLYLLLGLLAAALRFGLYAGLDDRGLLVPGQPMEYAMWAVTGMAVLLCPLLTRFCRVRELGGLLPGAGTILLAGCLGLSAWSAQSAFAGVGIAYQVLGAASVLALAVLTVQRLLHKKPAFACYGILCLFFVVQTVVCYQDWSENPQVLNYVFDVFAVLSLLLFSYYRASQCAGMKRKQMQYMTGLIGIFCCIAALPHSQWRILLAGGAAWLIGELSQLYPVKGV